MTCEKDHTPNAETAAAIMEIERNAARVVIEQLLRHAVYDRERSDECIAAVADAEAFLEARA